MGYSNEKSAYQTMRRGREGHNMEPMAIFTGQEKNKRLLCTKKATLYFLNGD